jgi:hypothetical protein
MKWRVIEAEKNRLMELFLKFSPFFQQTMTRLLKWQFGRMREKEKEMSARENVNKLFA